MNAHLEPDDPQRWRKCPGPGLVWTHWITMQRAHEKYQDEPAFTNDQSRVRESK